MTKRILPTEVAKIVRGELKKHFPGTKFSVTTRGWSSIRVNWTDGPTQAAVEAKVGQYCGASFDSMVDLTEHHSSQYQGETVRFGNDFIFCDRSHSGEALLAALEWYKTMKGDFAPKDIEFIPEHSNGRWTVEAHIATSDYNAQDEIYRHMRQTAL